jgi:hypothetical protein
MPFYQCAKCQRRWEYPLNECPFDFVPLQKMESKIARVNSVAKVSIPTLFHPAVPYYILLLEDENGNLWAHKSEKEYKVGDELKTESDTGNDAVAISRVKFDALDAIEKALESIGGLDLNPDSRVVVLPTLAAASHEYFRDNTSPKFLDAILSLLIERGVKSESITVGSQSFDEIPIAAVAQKSGLLGLAAKYKIAPTDLAAGEFEKVGQMEISKLVLRADLVINLAMEKIGQAVATTNMFRVLKKENYLGLQYMSSDIEIAALLESMLDKMIVIGEAENVQRSYKLTTFMGLVFAARSPRNLDRVFNEVAMSLKLPEIVKDCNMESIHVVGRSIKEVQYRAEIF